MVAASQYDEGFWHSAYRAHGSAVLGFLLRRLRGRRDEAEDLLQETFTRAIRVGSFRPGGNLRAYLLCIARNLLVNRIRRPRLVVTAAALEGEEPLGEVADEAASPEQEASWSVFRTQLDGVLGEMTRDHRTAFEMAILKQHTYGEIARATGWSLPRVKSNVYRARKRVIHALGEFLPVERSGVMKHCERIKESLSALVDGELEPVELVPTLDHLAECASCRTFYRGVRTLDEAVLDAELSTPSEPAPDTVWQRIRDERARTDRSASSRRAGRRMAWAPLLAASLVLAVGLTAVLWVQPGGAERYVEVTVSGDPDRMTEDRFIELTTELLEADRRYHRKMLEVMQVVNTQRSGGEGFSEGRRTEGGEPRPLWEASQGNRSEGPGADDHDL